VSALARLAVALVGAALAAPTVANHGTPEVILPVSKGVYRSPFTAGTAFRATNDHVSHNPHNRLDLSPTDNSVEHFVRAAAGGWIEYIVDGFDTTCPVTCVSYDPTLPGRAGTCCPRNSPGCGPCAGGPPGCTTACRNNYVWIRHANGEWTKYTHMKVGSVTAEGLVVGQWVPAGRRLGIEGNVGWATSVHLHFEVAVPDVVGAAPDPLGLTWDFGQIPNAVGDTATNGNRQNRVPVFCQLGFLRDDGTTYTATACDGQCTSDDPQIGGTVTTGTVYYRQSTNTATVGGPSAFTVQSGAGASVRAGERITLRPPFTAAAGSFFAASLSACDSPGW
jgi:hypothetical protein